MAYTLAQLRTELFELSGEIGDLDPTGSTVRADQMINEGQRRVAFYKTKRGRRVRFPQLFGEFNFQTSTITGTVVSGTATTVTLDAAAGAEDDRYQDWIIRINGGQDRLITTYSAARVATVNEDFQTTPAASDTYLLYKRGYRLLPSTHSWVMEHIQIPVQNTSGTGATDYYPEGNLLEIMKVVDLQDKRELEDAVRGEFFDNELVASGTPVEWYRFANTLKFDRALDEARWFRVEYYRAPTEMVGDSDIPEVDEAFHWGIVLWARWWALMRQQETGYTTSAMRDWTDFMEQTVSSWESKSERDRGPTMRINLGRRMLINSRGRR